MISNREDPLPFKSVFWWTESVEKFVIWIYMDRGTLPMEHLHPPQSATKGARVLNDGCTIWAANVFRTRHIKHHQAPHENIKRLNLNPFFGFWTVEIRIFLAKSFFRVASSYILNHEWSLNWHFYLHRFPHQPRTNPLEELWLPRLIFSVFFCLNYYYVVIFWGSWFLLS